MPHHLDYPAAVRRDGFALAEAAEAAGPAAPVAGCPGWDVAELVWHITEVHYFWGEIVAGGLQDPEMVPPLERPDGFPALLARFRAGVERLAAVLAAADPAAPVWTWARQKDAGFVIRHQAQETAVHRWDAEQAAGRAFTIDPDLAADSIDEFLEHTGRLAARRGGPRRRAPCTCTPPTPPGSGPSPRTTPGTLVVDRGPRQGATPPCAARPRTCCSCSTGDSSRERSRPSGTPACWSASWPARNLG